LTELDLHGFPRDEQNAKLLHFKLEFGLRNRTQVSGYRLAMTLARRHQFDPADPPWVHAISRCVRRAFLAGGKHEHRKSWLEDRLRLLAGVFAVEVAGYAVMSNHLHVVLRMDPSAAQSWSAATVVERWWTIYPRQRLRDGTPVTATAAQVREQARDAVWVAQRRQRLADLGWFMKALKEEISRRANREDGCTGAFWEGRFTSVPLLDNAALVACMAYVDLNPVRAGIAPTPEDSTHTGGRTRIRARNRWWATRRLRQRGRSAADVGRLLTKVGLDHAAAHPEDGLWLTPLARCRVAVPEGDVVPAVEGPLSVDAYLELLDATGRSLARGKRGSIDARLAPILARLDLRVEDWLATMVGWRMLWGGSAIGTWASRQAYAVSRGLDWIRNRSPLFAARAAS
jgi:REP element-mobilizing transposase RayT